MANLSAMIVKAAILAALTLPHAAAQASDTDGNFALRGYGSRTCEMYQTEKSDPGHANQYGSWLMGYVTARNRLQPDTFDILPFIDGMVLLQAISAVCADRKDITVENATSEVIRAIAPLHQRSASAALTIERGGQTVRIREEAIAKLQARLIERRLYAGSADGKWTDELSSAIQEFQLREQIASTGLPDLATLVRALVL